MTDQQMIFVAYRGIMAKLCYSPALGVYSSSMSPVHTDLEAFCLHRPLTRAVHRRIVRDIRKKYELYL